MTNYQKQDDAILEELITQIETWTEKEILVFIDANEKKLGLDKKNDTWTPIRCGFAAYFNNEPLDENGFPESPDIEIVTEKHRRKQKVLSNVFHKAFSLDVFENSSGDINGKEYTIAERINRLIDMADDIYETIFRWDRQYKRINHPTYIPVSDGSLHSLYIGSTIKLEDLNSHQTLILAMLNETYIQNLRRYKEQCCKQIINSDNYPTRAWKPLMLVSDFVHHIAQKETRFAVWNNLTAKGSSAKECINHLNTCKDMQFPEIVKNRHYWSFKNGIFAGKLLSKTGQYYCAFYPYESPEFHSLEQGVVSSKYFDKYFDTFDQCPARYDENTKHDDWWDIPTPHFKKILDYQNFDDGVQKWMYVMGGRLCYDVGELDSWQIVPFLKGIARSGKSTVITKVFKKFYESEDVKTLSNNIERKFGLGSIYDGLMFIAPEVKGDLCLEQAEFQSLVSGEDVSLAIKHEKAKSLEWKTPGILGGNEVPNWKDNSGSVLRRILPWNFGKQVHEADPHLDEKLDKELPAILLKCVKAYLDYSQKYSDQDIWNVVPEYFKKIQIQVAMVTNSLQNFLASEKVKCGSDLFVPQKDFIQSFNIHCQEGNLGRFKFNSDFYAGPFSSRNIEVVVEARTYKGRVCAKQPFFHGVDIVEDENEN